MTTNDSTPETQASGKCPVCGEAVKSVWKLCPACEAPLGRPVCPGCAAPVKENWKLCPECGRRLVCTGCGMHLPPEGGACMACRGQDAAAAAGARVLREPLSGVELVRVPGGDFEMGDLFGDGWDDEAPAHPVHLDAFFMGRYPVTQGEWLKVMGENPSMFPRGERHPVEQVDWAAVTEFLRRVNQHHRGLHSFRLPTEAEWEYAARSGGRRELYAGGDQLNALAWYQENSKGSTRPVGQKRPNGLGIHDMSGNVWEWCRDTYAPDAYAAHRQINPLTEGGGSLRVIRGGSWNLDAWSARCSRRFGFDEGYCGPGLGFRLVCEIG